MGKSSGTVVVLVLVAAIAIGYHVAGNYARDKVEKSVAELLPSLIGPAQSYRVEVEASTGQLMRRHLRAINIHGDRVSLPRNIVVDRLDVRLQGVDFDAKTSSVKNIDNAEFDATLLETNLNNYLTGLYPEIEEMKIRLMDGYCDFSARPLFAGLRPNLRAQAVLEIGEGRFVNARISKATTAGLPAPSPLRQYFEQQINPILNTADFGFDTTLKSVVVQPGLVTLSGDAHLMGRLRAGP